MTAQRRWVCSACGQTAPKGSGAAGSSTPPSCRNLWCTMPARPLSAIFAVGNYEGAFRSANASEVQVSTRDRALPLPVTVRKVTTDAPDTLRHR
jgi:hypothetical protein